MEIVVDLAILIVVCGIAFLLLRTQWRVCPHCASLFLERPVSDVAREPSPFLHVRAQAEPSPFAATPPAISDPNPSWDTPLVIMESEDDFPVLTTHEPFDMPTPSASLMTTPPQILESGEILIEPDTEGAVDLLSATDESQAGEDSGEELLLEEDIGLGPRGWPLASRLIKAGFGVTMTPQKWGGGGRRRPAPPSDTP